MSPPHDHAAAIDQARWLLDACRDHGASVDENDLRTRVGRAMRDAQGWEDLGGFRRFLAADDVTVTGARPDGEDAILDVRTPGGLRLERILRVDDDGRLASMTTRLAGGASMTMVSAAAWRAAHTAFDEPVILDDPFAGMLVGDASPYQADAVRDGTHGTTGFHYRWNMAARARLAEETLAEQRATAGVGQYVLLGAGLDSFALRNPFDDVTVFEVDTPESQAWKLDRLTQLGLATPSTVRHVPCDFETQDFVERLADAGFDADRPAVAAWLGVSYYLGRETISATLERVASWPEGSAIVFDFMLPERRWDGFAGYDADTLRAVVAGVAAAGEPFVSMFDEDELVGLCRSGGFDEVEVLGHDDIRARYMADRPSPTPGPDPVLELACARVGGSPASPARRHTIDDRLRDARARIERLSPAEAAAAQAEGAVIVDIRDSADRAAEGIIPGSHWTTRNTLEWRADPTSELPDPRLSDFAQRLVIVCNDGYASSLAADSLRELGHSRTADIVGGYRAWRAGGLPTAAVALPSPHE